MMICKETDKVMKLYMLSAFLSNVKHFIQINDHQQFCFQINNFKLFFKNQQKLLYQLNHSQFERLSVDEQEKSKSIKI